MKKFLLNLISKLHICQFNKPIVSQYVSFHTRNIVFECKCGKRHVERITKGFSAPFPIETAIMLSNQELDAILDGKSLLEVRGY